MRFSALCLIWADFDGQNCGGRGGIRTHEGVAPLAVFKTAALNHSATLPSCCNTLHYALRNGLNQPFATAGDFSTGPNFAESSPGQVGDQNAIQRETATPHYQCLD